MATFDPSRPSFAPYGLTCVQWKPSVMARADTHNEIEINFLPAGSVTYLIGGRRERLPVGTWAVFWAAVPHQVIEVSSTSPYFVATLPLAWFLQLNLPGRFVQLLLQGQLLRLQNPERAALDRHLFETWVESLQRSAEPERRATLAEIEARLVRFAAGLPPSQLRRRRSPVRLQAGGPSRVERLAAYLAQHYQKRLTVRQIARAVGLHPNYAMTLFQRTFGSTLVENLTRHRVMHAQRLLATTDQKITDVAFASGFSSVTRFNEAFRTLCHGTPRDYRKQHRL